MSKKILPKWKYWMIRRRLIGAGQEALVGLMLDLEAMRISNAEDLNINIDRLRTDLADEKKKLEKADQKQIKKLEEKILIAEKVKNIYNEQLNKISQLEKYLHVLQNNR